MEVFIVMVVLTVRAVIAPLISEDIVLSVANTVEIYETC